MISGLTTDFLQTKHLKQQNPQNRYPKRISKIHSKAQEDKQFD
jgi:hypothetical protein